MPNARDALLDAARRVVVAGEWERMPLAELAGRAGVSRQTLYNEFGSKYGLAAGAVGAGDASFLAGARRCPRVVSRRSGRRHPGGGGITLRTGADDPLLKAILSSARGPSELLPLLTTRAEPLLESSGKLLTGYLTGIGRT